MNARKQHISSRGKLPGLRGAEESISKVKIFAILKEVEIEKFKENELHRRFPVDEYLIKDALARFCLYEMCIYSVIPFSHNLPTARLLGKTLGLVIEKWNIVEQEFILADKNSLGRLVPN